MTTTATSPTPTRPTSRSQRRGDRLRGSWTTLVERERRGREQRRDLGRRRAELVTCSCVAHGSR